MKRIFVFILTLIFLGVFTTTTVQARLAFTERVVQPIILIPKDQKLHGSYQWAIIESNKIIQQWFADQLQGKTFKLNEPQTINSEYTIDDFRCGIGKKCSNVYAFGNNSIAINIFSLSTKYAQLQSGVSSQIFLIGGQTSGLGQYYKEYDLGITVTGDTLLDVIAELYPNGPSGDECAVVAHLPCSKDSIRGEIAHELGHTFGLDYYNLEGHTVPPERSLLNDWMSFPNTVLLDTPINPEKATLLNNKTDSTQGVNTPNISNIQFKTFPPSNDLFFQIDGSNFGNLNNARKVLIGNSLEILSTDNEHMSWTNDAIIIKISESQIQKLDQNLSFQVITATNTSNAFPYELGFNPRAYSNLLQRTKSQSQTPTPFPSSTPKPAGFNEVRELRGQIVTVCSEKKTAYTNRLEVILSENGQKVASSFTAVDGSWSLTYNFKTTPAGSSSPRYSLAYKGALDSSYKPFDNFSSQFFMSTSGAFGILVDNGIETINLDQKEYQITSECSVSGYMCLPFNTVNNQGKTYNQCGDSFCNLIPTCEKTSNVQCVDTLRCSDTCSQQLSGSSLCLDGNLKILSCCTNQPQQASNISCQNNPPGANPQSGYQWTALCDLPDCDPKLNHLDCPKSEDGSAGWCYGFSIGPKCLRRDKLVSKTQSTNSVSNSPPGSATVNVATANPVATVNSPTSDINNQQCQDNPPGATPPKDYKWTALCDTPCTGTGKDRCPEGADGQTGWCFGFPQGPRCLRLDRLNPEIIKAPEQPKEKSLEHLAILCPGSDEKPLYYANNTPVEDPSFSIPEGQDSITCELKEYYDNAPPGEEVKIQSVVYTNKEIPSVPHDEPAKGDNEDKKQQECSEQTITEYCDNGKVIRKFQKWIDNQCGQENFETKEDCSAENKDCQENHCVDKPQNVTPPIQEACKEEAHDLGEGIAQNFEICPNKQPEERGSKYCINGNPNVNDCSAKLGEGCSYNEGEPFCPAGQIHTCHGIYSDQGICGFKAGVDPDCSPCQ